MADAGALRASATPGASSPEASAAHGQADGGSVAPAAAPGRDGPHGARIFGNRDALARELAESVAAAAEEAVAAHGKFFLAIAGGSLPALLGQGLGVLMEAAGGRKPQMQNWVIGLVDERCVSLDHEESNFRLVKEAIMDQDWGVAVTVLAVDIADGTPEAMAPEYDGLLRTRIPCEAGVPQFDCILLGMGPDGHVASLFPGHALLHAPASPSVVFIGDSPKPPPARITLTMPVINAASTLLMVVTGTAKASAVGACFAAYDAHGAAAPAGEDDRLPAARVHTRGGALPTWLLDDAAARTLVPPPDVDGAE